MGRFMMGRRGREGRGRRKHEHEPEEGREEEMHGNGSVGLDERLRRQMLLPAVGSRRPRSRESVVVGSGRGNDGGL